LGEDGLDYATDKLLTIQREHLFLTRPMVTILIGHLPGQ
jgi:hypothetical protein